jgi:RNA polymerase sigma-54 factor
MHPTFTPRPTHAAHPTTAHLAQTMALLELSASELQQRIETELANNPALELREERICPTCHLALSGSAPCPRCTRQKSLDPNEPIIFVSPREDFHPGGSFASTEDLPDDNFSAVTEDLPTYVLRQIASELAPAERAIAATILTNLDEDGLLSISLYEVARYHHVPLSRVERVQSLIQRADPVGVGSTSSQDALVVQLEQLKEAGAIGGGPAGRAASADFWQAAAEAIRSGFDLLTSRQFGKLARRLGLGLRQVEELARFIGDNLNPYPARASWGDIRLGTEAPPNVYHFPDVLISRLNHNLESPLVVEVVAPYAGMLQVNPLFRQSFQKAEANGDENWRGDLERADLLVKCLQQRTNTIVRLMRRLLLLQRDFILNGDEHLQPVTRASLAEELQVHESTISRAVTGKTVQLPNGHIIPLAKFFDRSLQVRTAIKQIIECETRPLSDNEIVSTLRKQGYAVARRTVAKYRAMEGILPSHLR